MPSLESRKKQILLVEDEDIVRRLVNGFLRSHGYEVHEAADSDTATQLWARQKDQIDLLLTDIILDGGGNGTDFARQLRQQNPKLKVIFTSGLSQDSLALELECEDTTFVQKPYLPETLLAAVKDALGER